MATDAGPLQPFPVSFPEMALVDLRRRINATEWPDRQQVVDASHGVQLATARCVPRGYG